MKVAGLMEIWEKTASGQLTTVEYPVHLPIEDAGKICLALCLSHSVATRQFTVENG